jgi:hypothetical protein
MQPRLPLGDRKAVNSNTFRSAGYGATAVSGAVVLGAVFVADAFA